LVGMLPSEMRIAALAIYAVVVLPLACLAIANRTLRALLCERHQPRRRTDANPAAVDAPRPVLTEQERLAGTAEQGAALLAATRDGDIERALALLEVGADPGTAPAPDDRDQRPVLMLAATRDSWHGRAEAVLTLLANGADALVTDADGNTALHGAVLSADAGVA